VPRLFDLAKAADAAAEFSDNEFKIKDNGDATKIAAFEASGITTATTRTYTLPDADGTVVTTGTADIPDNVLNITDNADATKKIAFQASGITTGTTRTITMPDADVDLDDIGVPQVAAVHAVYTESGIVSSGYELVSTGSILDENGDFGSGLFTAPLTGTYSIRWDYSLTGDSSPDVTNINAQVQKNATTSLMGTVGQSGAGTTTGNREFLVQLTAGDTVGVYAQRSSGTGTDCSVNGFSTSTFVGTRLVITFISK
jgi:hypothetical protein